MSPSRAVTYIASPAAQGSALASAGYLTRPRLDRRSLLFAVVLLLAGALISGFTILQGLDPFDEGLVLQAARRVAAGQIAYRDFTWSYGPAQPYLLAGLFKLFGVSLLDWRVLRALADGAVALMAFVLVRPHVPRPLALAVWLTVACEMAEPRNANPFPFALVALLVALWLASTGEPDRGRVIGAAVLTAIAAAFRLDFTIYGGVAVAVVLALRGGARPALGYAGVSLALAALVYLPFVIVVGPASLYHALIGVSLETSAYWSLPFPWHYHAPPGAGLGKTLKHGLDFYVPLLVIAGLALTALAGATRTWHERRPPALVAGLVVFGAGLLAYMLSRTDDVHTQPLLVVVAMGLALTAASVPRPAALVCLAILSLLLVHGVANRASALLKPPVEVRLHVAVADGAMAAPKEAAAIETLVAIVDRNVPPGGPIYVLPRRSDLVRLNDPLIYVLTQRSNPTTADFGLLTGAAAQMHIVGVLRRVRPRVIVRWTDPISSSREPNLRGRSSGVHTLDDWVAQHYRPLARLYHYEVLAARG